VYAIAAALRSTNSALPSNIRLDDISNFETLLSEDEQREHAWNAIVAAVNTTSNTITTTSSEIPQWLQLKRTKDVTWIDQPLLTACQLFHNFHSSHPVELYKQKAFCANYDCENRFDAALERLWPQSANDDHSNEDGDNDAGNEDSGFLSMAPIAAPIALVKTIVGTTASVTKTVAGTMLSTIVPLPFGAEDADPSIIDQATQSKANAASAAAAAVALRGRYTFLDPLDDVLFSADHHHATVSVEDDNADPAVVLAKLRKQLQVKEDTAQSQAQQAARIDETQQQQPDLGQGLGIVATVLSTATTVVTLGLVGSSSGKSTTSDSASPSKQATIRSNYNVSSASVVEPEADTGNEEDRDSRIDEMLQQLKHDQLAQDEKRKKASAHVHGGRSHKQMVLDRAAKAAAAIMTHTVQHMPVDVKEKPVDAILATNVVGVYTVDTVGRESDNPQQFPARRDNCVRFFPLTTLVDNKDEESEALRRASAERMLRLAEFNSKKHQQHYIDILLHQPHPHHHHHHHPPTDAPPAQPQQQHDEATVGAQTTEVPPELQEALDANEIRFQERLAAKEQHVESLNAFKQELLHAIHSTQTSPESQAAPPPHTQHQLTELPRAEQLLRARLTDPAANALLANTKNALAQSVDNVQKLRIAAADADKVVARKEQEQLDAEHEHAMKKQRYRERQQLDLYQHEEIIHANNSKLRSYRQDQLPVLVEQKLQIQERLQGLLLQQQEQLLHPFNTQTLELLLQSHEAARQQQTDAHTKQSSELNVTLARRQQEVEQQFAVQEKELNEKMAQVSAEEQATDEKWKQSEETVASLRTELATIDEKLATQEL
jgi:hypothetical protein